MKCYIISKITFIKACSFNYCFVLLIVKAVNCGCTSKCSILFYLCIVGILK